MKIRKIPVILGPTCVGKTDLALKIAKETNANIISIDSRQVFEGLDIGTGKIKSNSFVSKSPFVWLVDGVKIFGYDVLKPNEEINVVKFNVSRKTYYIISFILLPFTLTLIYPIYLIKEKFKTKK